MEDQERSALATAISFFFLIFPNGKLSVTGTSGFNNKINFVEMFTFKQSNRNDKCKELPRGKIAPSDHSLVGVALSERVFHDYTV